MFLRGGVRTFRSNWSSEHTEIHTPKIYCLQHDRLRPQDRALSIAEGIESLHLEHQYTTAEVRFRFGFEEAMT